MDRAQMLQTVPHRTPLGSSPQISEGDENKSPPKPKPAQIRAVFNCHTTTAAATAATVTAHHTRSYTHTHTHTYEAHIYTSHPCLGADVLSTFITGCAARPSAAGSRPGRECAHRQTTYNRNVWCVRVMCEHVTVYVCVCV